MFENLLIQNVWQLLQHRKLEEIYCVAIMSQPRKSSVTSSSMCYIFCFVFFFGQERKRNSVSLLLCDFSSLSLVHYILSTISTDKTNGILMKKNKNKVHIYLRIYLDDFRGHVFLQISIGCIFIFAEVITSIRCGYCFCFQFCFITVVDTHS